MKQQKEGNGLKIMKGMVALALLVLMSCIAVTGAAEDTSLSWMAFSSEMEESYLSVRSAYMLPAYAGEDMCQEVALHMGVGDTRTIRFTAPEDGQYEIWLTYRNTSQAILPTDMDIALDGGYPFSELHSVQFRSLWVDEGVFPQDRYGNENSTIPYAADVTLEAGLSDSASRTMTPFLFELTAGEHELTLTVQDGEIALSALTLKAPTAYAPYEQGDTSGDHIIVIEAEKITSRNSSSIRANGEYITTLSPYSTDRRLINHLAGSSFNQAGDVATWSFTVEEAGWYNFGAYYRQNIRQDFPVFIDILIDGQAPSEAALAVPFDFYDGFTYMQAQYEGRAQSFYLSEGEHTLSLRINAECFTALFEMIGEMTNEINALSQEITRLSGGITTDQYRHYNILGSIPDLPNILSAWADECETMLASIGEINAGSKLTAFSYLELCVVQLRDLAESPEDIPRRISELSTGSNSVAKYLSQLLLDISYNNVDIDQIYFYQDQAALPEKPNAIESAFMSISRFFQSFNLSGYSASSEGEEGHLQVWMGESRVLVEVLQNIIDSDFTAKTGIVVDLAILPSESKLVLSNAAGNAPDVALSISSVTPSYLDIRGALYDLTQFEDFPKVADRFTSSLFIPYIYDNGVYALPQQVNAWVLYYRKDILDSIGLEVPQTLKDVKDMLPELQARGMNFYYPTAGMSGTKIFSGTLPVILQAGGSVYGDTVAETTLDTEASLNGFRELTELFTIYSMPLDSGSGFYQRFRDGTLPIGIADMSIYNLLNNAAPELDGLWDIALIPGLENEDGEVQRWIIGNLKAMGIMANTDMPQEAWEFLKWWSSEEVQSTYANLLFTTYGEDTLWASANQDAFAQLPIKYTHKQTMLEQMSWMTDAPWCLGTYMVERELSNAFLSVTVDGVDVRRALDKAIKAIDRETYRKLEEFGYYENGVMVKEYITPSKSLIENMIREYSESHPEEE